MITEVMHTVVPKNDAPNKVRMVWIDKLRVISMIAVIIIHVTANTIETFGLSGTAEKIFFIIKHLCFFSIGIFIMISGAMFLNRNITVKDMFKKYISKIFIALIVFGAIYSTIEIFFIEKKLNLNYIPQIIIKIITGDLWAHMWYLYLIIGIYMVTPIIRAITQNINESVLKYLMGILFIFKFLVSDISYIFNINIAFNIEISAFLLYYIYGYYITNFEVSKKYTYSSYILGIASFVIIAILAFFNKYMGLITYTSSLVFLCSNAIFLFIKNRKEKKQKIDNFIVSLGTCSFGIYLVHQFFINVIYKLFKFDIIIRFPYICLPLYVIIITTISYAVVYVLKKIKIISKYLL